MKYIPVPEVIKKEQAVENILMTIDEIPLFCAYQELRNNNKGNDLPYHNYYHALCMIKNCFDGAVAHNLSKRETTILLYSALFHDFNHSGGPLTDDKNIELAIFALDHFFREHPIDENDIQIIKSNIYVTEYPFVHNPDTLIKKILRDCDLMQCLESCWYEHVIFGLKDELEIKLGKTITEQEMIKSQMEFLKKSEWFTLWGKEKFLERRLNIFTTLHEKLISFA